MDASVRRCLSLYHRGEEQWATQEGAQNIRRWHLWLGDRRNGTNGTNGTESSKGGGGGGSGGIGGLKAGGVEVKEVKEDDTENENEDEDEEEGEYSSVILDEEDDDGRVVVEGGLVRGKWTPVNPLGLLANKVR